MLLGVGVEEVANADPQCDDTGKLDAKGRQHRTAGSGQAVQSSCHLHGVATLKGGKKGFCFWAMAPFLFFLFLFHTHTHTHTLSLSLSL